MSSVLMLEYMSNCCCVMGGSTAFMGFCERPWAPPRGGPVTREFVMEAIRCRGDAVVAMRDAPLLTGEDSSTEEDIRLPMVEAAKTGGKNGVF